MAAVSSLKASALSSELIASLLFAGTALLTLRWQRRASIREDNNVVKKEDDLELEDTSSTTDSVHADDALGLTSNNVEDKDKSMRVVRYLSDHGKRSGDSDWDLYTDEEEIMVQKMPKIELHVHLDGAFDSHYLFQYMKKNPESIHCLPNETDLPWEPGRKLAIRSMVQKCKTQRDYHKLCTCRGYRSLKEMLNCFEMFLPLVRGNLELLEQLAFDFCQRQWEQHVIYTEVRYSPHLLAEGFQVTDDKHSSSNGTTTTTSRKNVTAEMVLQAVTRGLRRGSKQFGIKVNQILCAITWRPDWAIPTLELVQKYQHDTPCATVGVDVAAGEEHFDKENFPNEHVKHYEMIQRAKELGIPISIHAGESTDQARENIRRAITEYGASRIGHGYRMNESEELMNMVRDNQCHVEVCPTSSVETGGWVYDEIKNWKLHPCLDMLRSGVKFSFSSDDPAVFHTSLAWQYRIALAKMGLTREELLQTNLDAIDASFCTPEEKNDLRATLEIHERRSARRSFRKAATESFADRVYLSGKEYI